MSQAQNFFADRIQIVARSVAHMAWTHYFVFFAERWRQHHQFDGWLSFACFGLNAFAIFFAQEAWFTEATDDALFRANWAWIGIFARWSAS
jgi:hypothetical protein